ncbi:hypothetical protein BU23DRAFT_389945, partial [Bimuria novae-zelandiae CBS 107.79]
TVIYDYSELTPSPELNWTSCYDKFTCTLLQVPLDYSDPLAGTTNLGIIRLAANNSTAEDILLNQGGPGGSGVEFVLLAAESIMEKIGRNYNLIGIDPRGVNNSGPDIRCFPGYPLAGRNSFYADVFPAVDNSSEYGLQTSFQHANTYGEWCSGIYSVNNTAKYVGTIAVAQDFLHYTELTAKARNREPSEAKLNYYGISYGSLLGVTIATLFPDRINRMVIDGVMDTEDYYSGGWRTFAYDTDEAVRAIFEACLEAGPELCVFHQNASSWEQLEERYNAILDGLRQAPIVVAAPLSPLVQELNLLPYAFTWLDLLEVTFSASYGPFTTYPHLVQLLAQLESGNTSSLADVATRAATFSPAQEDAYDSREPRTLVSCLDAQGRFNTSNIEEYADHIAFMTNQSQYGGLVVPSFSGPICSKLNIFPPESQSWKGLPRTITTSAPILLIGNVADPITPLQSAKRVSGFFPGSEVLI